MMTELTNSELDERLQKQVLLAQSALEKGGNDYVIQISCEILKHQPGAFETRGLLWRALHSEIQSSGWSWMQDKSSGISFKLSTRSLLKKDPLQLIRRCDDQLRDKRVFTEVFLSLERASETLKWLETRIVAYRSLVDLHPDYFEFRLRLSELLLDAKRPQQSIELLEWVLARDSGNAEAQSLLKSASVAETLQRGNWEDSKSSFHNKRLGE